MNEAMSVAGMGIVCGAVWVTGVAMLEGLGTSGLQVYGEMEAGGVYESRYSCIVFHV